MRVSHALPPASPARSRSTVSRCSALFVQMFFDELPRTDSFMGAEPAAAFVVVNEPEEVIGVVVGHRVSGFLPQVQEMGVLTDDTDCNSSIAYVLSLGVREDFRW